MPTTITLNATEAAILNTPDQGQGGFQSLMAKLQNQYDPATGQLPLDDADLERIPRYAFDYENGGWQGRLVGALGRNLGPNLGR